MHKIFVYGSLKEGQYNFGRFGETKVLKKNIRINGFALYSLGPYPCIIKTNNPQNFVIGEIHEVSDNNYGNIYRMEIGAGYYAEEFNLDEFSNVTVFPMNQSNLKYYGGKLIENGIW